MMKQNLDLRIQKTYLALHNAFTELLEQKHFENITVNELCEKAMIRRTTFYKHFADKYEYYTFYLKEISLTFRQDISFEAFDTDVNSYYMEMSRKLILFLEENKKLMDTVLHSETFPALLSILSVEIAQDFYEAALHLHTDMTPAQLESFCSFYTGGLLNMMLSYYKKNHTFEGNPFLQILHRVLFTS